MVPPSTTPFSSASIDGGRKAPDEVITPKKTPDPNARTDHASAKNDAGTPAHEASGSNAPKP
jgi:hypothetical protein